MIGSGYCFTHNPKTKSAQRKAAKKGGKASGIKKMNLPPIEINDVEDVTRVLNDTTNQLRQGKIDIKTANCISIMMANIIKTMEMKDKKDRSYNFI